jgi:F-type H+-transporting ATPase subunit epsilon
VVSPEKLVYEGDVAAIVAPAWDGKVGILPGHAPFLALLGHGHLALDLAKGGSQTHYVAGGVLKVEGEAVTVLTEYAGAEAPDVIPQEAIVHLDDVVFGNPLI